MGTKLLFLSALLASALSLSASPAQAQKPAPEDVVARALVHQSPEWLLVEPHLPDPRTATPAALEQAADVLRARRFNEDALDFYRSALDRGGDPFRLMNRLGITELELRQPQLARAYFLRAATIRPKDGQIWNNLGAAEFLAGNVRPALANYSRAVKLDKKNAVFHSNLATAYFEAKDFESARQHFEKAFALDPKIYQRDDGAGIEARVFSSTDHGRFCFELARVAARQHDDERVVLWLGKASDSGFDIQEQMTFDRSFEAYRKDPRVLVILQNARALRAARIATATPVEPLSTSPAPPQ